MSHALVLPQGRVSRRQPRADRDAQGLGGGWAAEGRGRCAGCGRHRWRVGGLCGPCRRGQPPRPGRAVTGRAVTGRTAWQAAEIAGRVERYRANWAAGRDLYTGRRLTAEELVLESRE